MPKIPTYDVFQEQSRPVSGVREESIASPGLLDAGAERQMQMGNTLQNAGADIGKVALQMQDRQNADMLFRAETAVQTDYIGFEQTIRERQGQSAWGATQDAAKWWDDKQRENLDNLENDVQRRLFKQSVAKLRLRSLDAIATYESGERKKSLEQSAQASIVSSTNMAAAYVASNGLPKSGTTVGDEPPEIGTDADGNPMAKAPSVNLAIDNTLLPYKQDIQKRVQVLAQLNGWSPELRDAKEAEYLTNFHSQIIQNVADKDPDGAKAYYEANKGEINGSVRDKLDKLLKTSGLKKTAQTFADEVDQSGLTEASAITAARQKFEGEQEEAVVQEIKTRFREQVDAKELLQKKAGDQAWDIYAKTKRLSEIPSDVLNDMDGKVRIALEKQAEADAAGVAVKTDPNVYYELRQMAVRDPERFQKTDLRQFFNKLDEGDREKFIDLQHPDKIKEAATLESQLSNMHDQLGWGASDREQKGNFDRVVTNAIQEEQRRKGKDLTQEERQKVIDRMVLDGEVMSGHWYTNDPNKKLYEVYGTEDAANFAPKVPDVDRKKIEAALKRSGKPVTDAEVTRLFKLKNGLQ